MKHILTLLLIGIVFPVVQAQFNWKAVEGGRQAAIEILSQQEGILIGYLKGKEQFATSSDQGVSWNILTDKPNEEFSELWEVHAAANKMYALYGGTRLYDFDLSTGISTLITSSSFILRDISIQNDTIFFIQNETLSYITNNSPTIQETQFTGFRELVPFNDAFLLRNKQDSIITVVSRNFNTIITPRTINLHSSKTLHAFENQLYVEQSFELLRSIDLGQTWESIYDFPSGGAFFFKGAFLGNLMPTSCSMVDLRTGQLVFSQDLQALQAQFFSRFNFGDESFFLHDILSDTHFSVDVDGITQLPTNIDNPSTKRVIAIDNDRAYFEYTSPFSAFTTVDQWKPVPTYSDVHLNNQGDLLATANDTVYISQNGGQSFSAQDYAITGRIRPDTTGRLYIFNEDYYFISDDDGYTWENDNRRNYFTHFTLNLEGLNHIYPINDNFYGLSETANTLKMGSQAATLHADFPWNGDQRYQSFVVNKSTEPFVLFYESFGNGDAVLMRKLNDQNEERLTLPFEPEEMYIDQDGRLYLHSNAEVAFSEDKGETWTNITGNLPTDIKITSLDVAPDATIYVTSSNTNPYKLEFGVTSSTINDATPTSLSFTISPNPAQKVIQITGELPLNARYSIFNQSGQLIDEGNLSLHQTVQIDHLTPELYTVQVSANNTTLSQKFIKH